jgi:CheY-like chemotaxis protein
VDILTRTSDESSVPEIKEAVQRYKNTASLFVTCGWVSLYVRESLKSSDTPQIFLPVLDSVALKLVPSLTMPPNTNITGVYLRYPPEKVTRLAVNLMPRIKNFAYVYDSRIPADVVYKASFEGMKGGHGGLTLHYIDLAKGMDAAIQELKDRHIEAMCFIVGGFQHLKPLKKAGIPIVSAFTLDMDEQSLKVFLANDLPASQATEAPKTAAPTLAQPVKPLKLLIMDDDSMILELAALMLKELGYEVMTAVNGEEALDIYKKSLSSERPVDIVIMDITVKGGMGAKETMPMLLALNPNVKAVVSSGYSKDPIMANYKEYGFAAALPKPYRIQEMTELLEKLAETVSKE